MNNLPTFSQLLFKIEASFKEGLFLSGFCVILEVSI